jgi:uncharacterized membrane protein YraQ (UPF0718 family)
LAFRNEWKKLALIAGIFLACFYLPVGAKRFDNAVMESLYLVKWYAQEHVILCLVPAFFIAGAISVFVSQASVMKYFGPKANRVLAYGAASISGSILAVCSCTVLPLFAGIWRMGAGLGPATAFLYSGPAINVLAIILTARILGLEIGIARAVGAISFSVIIGLIMHFIYRKEELEKANGQMNMPEPQVSRPLLQNALFFAAMIGVLVFANWSKPLEGDHGLWSSIHKYKWWIAGFSLLSLAVILFRWFKKDELKEWTSATWGFALQILPLLLGGVLVSGFLLGRVGHEGIIPNRWVEWAVGGNSLRANLLSSVVAAFMYFATLTEVPILQGLIGSGMGKGPALALLLAGPALSLPSMLVLRSIMGTQKTVVYVSLVIVMSTIVGMFFGAFF